MVKWISGFKRFFEDNDGNFSMTRLKTFLANIVALYLAIYMIIFHFDAMSWIHLALVIILLAYSFGEKIFSQALEYFRAKLGK